MEYNPANNLECPNGRAFGLAIKWPDGKKYIFGVLKLISSLFIAKPMHAF